jgi:hypothetical protein
MEAKQSAHRQLHFAFFQDRGHANLRLNSRMTVADWRKLGARLLQHTELLTSSGRDDIEVSPQNTDTDMMSPTKLLSNSIK